MPCTPFAGIGHILVIGLYVFDVKLFPWLFHFVGVSDHGN